MADSWTTGLRFPARAKIFLFATKSMPALGPIQPPIQQVSRALSPGVKLPGRESDHSLLSSAPSWECEEPYLHPNMSSWSGALLITGTDLPLPYKRFWGLCGWKTWSNIQRREDKYEISQKRALTKCLEKGKQNTNDRALRSAILHANLTSFPSSVLGQF